MIAIPSRSFSLAALRRHTDNGMESTSEIVYAAVGIALLLVMPASVTLSKGYAAVFFVGFLVPIAWWLTAFRRARPGSAWARRFDGPSASSKHRRIRAWPRKR